MEGIHIKVQRKTIEEKLDDVQSFFDKLVKKPELIDSFDKYNYIPLQTDISKVFTEARIKVLNQAKKNPGMNLTKLSKKLKRKVEAVSRDLHILEKYNLLKISKQGKEIQINVKPTHIIMKI